MRSFSNIMPNFADKLHLLVDSISVKIKTFSELRKKISFFICNFAAEFEESYMDMRLFTHTQPSFVQSFRRFERSSHVQQFCTPTSGIGFPRHQMYSHFRPTA